MKGARRLRLFMTTDAVGGVWTYALDLASELAKAGVQTTLAVLGPKPDEDQLEAAEDIPRLELLETGLPLDWTAESAGELKAAARLVAGLARKHKADIVHLNGVTLAAYAEFDAPVIGAAHSCVGTWWDHAKGGRLPPDFRWRVEALGKGYAACDALLSPSQAFAEATAKRHKVETPKVVHNGRRHAAPRGPKSDTLIFTAGRLWDAGKNLATLDRAAARLDVPVFAAGALQSPTGELAKLEHLRLLGRLTETEIGDWMGRARIFVSPALYEPFGLSALEAAQAGCALVFSDIPTFHELWEGAAVFAPARDEAALADLLQSLLDDPKRAQDLGRAARERSKDYTVAAMAAGTLAIYREALAAAELKEAAA